MAHHAIFVGGGEIVHFTGGATDDTSLEARHVPPALGRAS